MRRWAWEFLRRNKRYRADYAKFRAVAEGLESSPEILPLHGHIDFDHLSLDRWNCFPPAEKGETLEEYLVRVPQCYRILRRDKAIQEDWYLRTPADPDCAFDPKRVDFFGPETLYLSENLIPRAPYSLQLFIRHDEVVFRVNLAGNVNEQVKRLLKVVRAKARAQKSFIDQFPLWSVFHLMLRYWDANAERTMRRGNRFDLATFKAALEADAALHRAFRTARFAQRARDLEDLRPHTTRGSWDPYLRQLINERGYVQLANFRPVAKKRRPRRQKAGPP